MEELLKSNQQYDVHFGDCIKHMDKMPPACADLSVFSPPFPSLYAFTDSEADIGNCEDVETEASLHLSFFYRQLARIVKPGRVIMVHVMQIPSMKRSGGDGGLHDFRGLNIRLGKRAGLIYEYDWLIRKNPQSQAIRTRSRELQFAGLESDRAKSRGALCDYLIKFRPRGQNAVPVDGEGEVYRNEWINWAEGHWSDIRETDTLNVSEGRGENDTKHICPLQLGVIDRIVRLYSNRDEIVFSPFTGIGSEGYQSLLRWRRFYGCELKKEYFDAAKVNMERAIAKRQQEQGGLFQATDPEPVAGGGDYVEVPFDPEVDDVMINAAGSGEED